MDKNRNIGTIEYEEDDDDQEDNGTGTNDK